MRLAVNIPLLPILTIFIRGAGGILVAPETLNITTASEYLGTILLTLFTVVIGANTPNGVLPVGSVLKNVFTNTLAVIYSAILLLHKTVATEFDDTSELFNCAIVLLTVIVALLFVGAMLIVASGVGTLAFVLNTIAPGIILVLALLIILFVGLILLTCIEFGSTMSVFGLNKIDEVVADPC
jgi:hypothetical protein